MQVCCNALLMVPYQQCSTFAPLKRESGQHGHTGEWSGASWCRMTEMTGTIWNPLSASARLPEPSQSPYPRSHG
jgi:hypothetical protein